MRDILGISMAASMGIHALVFLASRGPGTTHSTAAIAKELCVSESHLGKVLRALGKKGFLTSTRGPHGGFSILDNTPKASVLSVLEAIDGPFTSPSCQITQPACRADGCALLHLAAEHHENLVHRLNNLSIGAMAKMG